MNLLFKILLFGTIIISGCVDVYGNDIELVADLDFCKAVETIKSKEEEDDVGEYQLLQREWEECEYNEDCETQLCMCLTCIDIAKFIKIE